MHLEYTNIPGIHKKECIGLFDSNIRNIAFALDIGKNANVNSKGNMPYIPFKEAYAFLFVYSWNIRIFQMHSSWNIPGIYVSSREVGGWGREPKKCTGRDWEMGSSTI